MGPEARISDIPQGRVMQGLKFVHGAANLYQNQSQSKKRPPTKCFLDAIEKQDFSLYRTPIVNLNFFAR